jgi:hypothetical protein
VPPIDGEPTLDSDLLAELTASFSETARTVFSGGGVQRTLEQVMAVAVETIEGCDLAGLFHSGGDTAVRSDPLVGEIDSLQRACAEGPGLDAIAQRLMIYGENLAEDTRWPSFGPGADARGVRSVVALPMTTDTGPSALSLYSRHAAAFSVVDRAKGVILATLAGVALTVAHSFEDEERRNLNLHTALSSREVIGQAQGILMEREQIGADQAFEVLRRASRFLNVKLREVAQTLVDTGERPHTGP